MNFETDIITHIQLLIGSIGVTIGLFFGIFLIVTREQRPKSNLFLAIYLLGFGLRIGKSLFVNYFEVAPTILNIFLAMYLVIGPSLWFYIKYSYYPGQAFDRRILWHYLPFFCLLAFCWLIPNDDSIVSRIKHYGLLAHLLTYSVFSLYWLLKEKSARKLAEPDKTGKWLVYLCIITIAMALMYIGPLLHISPYLWGAFLFSVAMFFLSLWGLKYPYLFKAKQERYANSLLDHNRAGDYIGQLNALMEDEKPFLDPELTLMTLAGRVGISPKQLSQAINQVQHENYSQYIARYRVREAKRLLKLEAYSNYKIAAIAYESGFNSLSSFNAAFKKLNGTTAVEYRKSTVDLEQKDR